MKTLLITRPEKDAYALAATFSAQGFRCICEPMLIIEPIAEAGQQVMAALTRQPQAILITSRHGVEKLAALTPQRSIPLVTVGKATASDARRRGFTDVHDAGGTANALITMLNNHLNPQNGSLLYLRGQHIRIDIAGKLKRSGFTVESITLYGARASRQLSLYTRQALQGAAVDAILFFSARSAAIYAKLAKQHDLIEIHSGIAALCMSDGIAHEAKAISWQKLLVAAKPDKESMIALAGMLN